MNRLCVEWVSGFGVGRKRYRGTGEIRWALGLSYWAGNRWVGWPGGAGKPTALTLCLLFSHMAL